MRYGSERNYESGTSDAGLPEESEVETKRLLLSELPERGGKGSRSADQRMGAGRISQGTKAIILILSRSKFVTLKEIDWTSQIVISKKNSNIKQITKMKHRFFFASCCWWRRQAVRVNRS